MSSEQRLARAWSGVTQFTVSTQEVERHIPLLRKMIETYDYGPTLTYEEKFAAGLVGIAIALQRYEPSRDVKLSYWISFQIDCEIRMETRAVATRRKYCRVSSSYAERAEALEDRANERELDKREENAARLKRLMYQAMEALPTRERKIVEGIYLERKTQQALAKELGVAQSWVSRLLRAAIEKVRRETQRLAKAEGVKWEEMETAPLS